MDINKSRVLMTGAGAPGAAGIIKCLTTTDNIELIIADADNNAVGRYLHPQFVHIPKAGDADFIPEVMTVCRHYGINVIMPLVTKELLPLAFAKDKFLELGVHVLVSPATAIERSNNKGACYQFLMEAGIRVPRFFVVTSTEQFVNAAFELGHPALPFCFKPTESNGSRGFRVVSDSINESDVLFNHKPYHTGITYAHALRILSAQPFPPLLVTPFLPHDEFSVDCLADKGTTHLMVPRKRIKMNNGISVQGVFEEKPELQAYCRDIIAALGLHGNIGLQMKYGVDGLPYLLEINPRVQGTIVAALGAGVNLPRLAVAQALGESVTGYQVDVRWGTAFSRYWTEVFY